MTRQTLFWLLWLWTTALAAAPMAERRLRLQGELQQPAAVAVAAEGRAFVLDGLERRVLVFGADGTRLGNFPLPEPDAGEGRLATDIALADQRLYVADPADHSIRVLALDGTLLERLQPRPDGEPAEPSAVRVSGADLWWSDRRSHRGCRSELKRGGAVRCWGGRGEAEGQFAFPYMLAEDADGYLLAVDVLNARVQILSPGGRVFGILGHFGVTQDRLFRPNGIARGEAGRVFVSDVYRGTLSVFERRLPIGLLHDPAGRPWRFAAPVGLARWRDRLYVVDMADHSLSVLRLLPDREITAETPAARPARDSSKSCLQCHISWAAGYRSDTEDTEVLPVNGQCMCFSCHHGAVLESRHRLGRGHQHPTLHQQRDGAPAGDTRRYQDEVPAAFPRSGNGRLHCGSCHSPHEKHESKPEGGVAFRSGMKNPWLRMANPDNEMCRACHASKVSAVDSAQDPAAVLNHPVGIPMESPPQPDPAGYPKRKELRQGLPEALAQKGARLSSTGHLTCQSCHRVHAGSGEPLLVDSDEAGRLYVACHSGQHATDADDARRKGIHPVNLALEEPVQLAGREIRSVGCLSCHAVHDAEPGSALLHRGLDKKTLCQACHPRQHASGREQAVHPVNVALEQPVNLGGRRVRELDCRTCHTVHEGVKDTPALVASHRDGTLCRACHEAQTKVAGSDHDLARTRPQGRNRLDQSHAEAGLCGACHSLHRGRKGLPFLYAGPAPSGETAASQTGPRDRLCLACHRDENPLDAKPLQHFTHPYRDLVLRSDPADLPLLDEADRFAEFGRIGCISCHDPHRWRPGGGLHPVRPAGDGKNKEGTVLTSFLRRRGASGSFCVSCHGLEARVKYQYFHDEPGREKGVGYLR